MTYSYLYSLDYHPFGMMMDGRSFSASEYRFGFNGKENDNEVKGKGNQQDYGMRIYNTRLGRFLSVDPITNEYPELSPYQFAGNTPISAADLDGLEPDIKFESGHSVQMIGGKGVDKEEYNKAFDRMSGDGGIVAGMASALGLRGLISFYNFVNSPAATPKPGTPSNNPRTPSTTTKITNQKPNSNSNPYLGKTKEQLEDAKESFTKLIKEHKDKIEKFKKDPIGGTSKEKMAEMTKDNPSKETLMKRVMGRVNELEKQLRKQEGELNKVQEALKKRE